MHSKSARLDRFVSVKTGINRKAVRMLLAQKRIEVNGCVATDIHQLVDEFSRVVFDGQVLQNNTPIYIMMNKPVGVVSATKDEKNKTVIDVLQQNNPNNIETDALHIVGRLDFNTSGLLLLTNDGYWSRRLTMPAQKIKKHYRVTLQNPIDERYVQAFSEGMYFEYENIITKPAQLIIINDRLAEVILIEGRYHQIKRMFGRFQNPVTALHRTAIGNLALDITLAPGASRVLTASEIINIG